ncbi:MAG: fibronectin type III domain-containing protein [Bacteroidales bacterium]|nr:fibronectin type III domain-containing protein [Bacteroidales bacterium]
MKNFITLFTFILLSFYLSAQYQITKISGSSYSGSFISGQNSTIYLCNESGVTFYSNLPSSEKVGNKSYSNTWQTSSDGKSWFSWSSQPVSSSDRYFRACLSYQKSSTDILYPTAWVKVIHSKVTYVSPPVTLEASEITNTSFTANWVNSTTEDNTGGGLCIKHSLGYTSEETTDFSAASSAGKVKWIDVSGLTSYTVSNLTKGTKYYWRVIAQTYNKNTNNYNYTDNTYNWYCGVQTYNSNGIMITETGGA